MTGERKERQVVAYSEEHAYFIPGTMGENPNIENQRIDLGNVFTGLQWYQAFNNDTGPLGKEEKVDILLEIFKEPNDFLGLAKAVEMQTGTEGLVTAVLESYSWAEWKLYPQRPNVTEAIFAIPHICVEAATGQQPISAVSFRKFDPDEENLKKKRKGEVITLSNDTKTDAEFTIFKGDEDIDYMDYEEGHEILPFFELRFIEILHGGKIRLEGIDTEDLEVDEESRYSNRRFYSYILTKGGKLEFETRKKIDKKLALRQSLKTAKEPIIITSVDDEFDWDKLREMIISNEMGRKALAYFLLPYCDMPTTDGHYYVLPEEMING